MDLKLVCTNDSHYTHKDDAEAQDLLLCIQTNSLYDDPKLPYNSIDLIILVDVYHEFSEPQKMLRKMRDSLKPDGRLVLTGGAAGDNLDIDGAQE